jgi:hypothetical protein
MEANMEVEVPTVLGAVAAATTSDLDVLTGTVCGCNACDQTTDYAKGGGEEF